MPTLRIHLRQQPHRAVVILLFMGLMAQPPATAHRVKPVRPVIDQSTVQERRREAEARRAEILAERRRAWLERRAEAEALRRHPVEPRQVAGQPPVDIRPTAPVDPTGNGWAVAKRVGDANWVRDAPNHRAHIIEKILQNTRFRVLAKGADPFGSVYYQVELPDGKVGWLDHVCVRFVR